MSMDNLAAMRVFVSVVETGGLSAAGRALGMAPSSVSRRIELLESMLGVRLLQRTTRKLNLTEAGENYFERSRDILRAVEEANLAVMDDRARPSGILRVTVPASVARRHLTPAFADFKALFPMVSMVVSVTDRVADVVGDGLDVAIRIGQMDDSSLMARKLGEARRLVCASPAYLTNARHPHRPEDLLEHDCLTFRSHPGRNSWQFGNGNTRVQVAVTGPFFADDGEVLVAAASAGLGLILVPEWLVGAELSQGKLVEVLTEFSPYPIATPLHAVFAPGPYVAPKIRVFIDFLANRFSSGNFWQLAP